MRVLRGPSPFDALTRPLARSTTRRFRSPRVVARFPFTDRSVSDHLDDLGPRPTHPDGPVPAPAFSYNIRVLLCQFGVSDS